MKNDDILRFTCTCVIKLFHCETLVTSAYIRTFRIIANTITRSWYLGALIDVCEKCHSKTLNTIYGDRLSITSNKSSVSLPYMIIKSLQISMQCYMHCGLVMPYQYKYIHCFPDNIRSCKDRCKIRRCWYIPDYTWRCRLNIRQCLWLHKESFVIFMSKFYRRSSLLSWKQTSNIYKYVK